VSANWLYSFVLTQFVLQSALIIPGIGPARTVLRAALFGSSIAMLALPGRGNYPLSYSVGFVLLCVTLGFVNPGLNTVLAGFATIGFYIAIWCPVYWVGRINITPRVLSTLLLIIWGFHSISAIIGVMQVYDPARFAPDTEYFESLSANSQDLKIELASGEKVYRPFGLTDSPGGAAVSGSLAVLLGLMLIGGCNRPLAVLGAASVMVGLFCIYLSYIRSILVVMSISVCAMVVLLVVRGQIARSGWIAGFAATAVIVAFGWATAIGGDKVTERMTTLIEDDPGKVYQSNRGRFLEETITDYLPQYPMGAGLGRHGMMNVYFGTQSNPDSPPLWSEIQCTAWVFDGGILLLLAGYSAVIGACVVASRLALQVADPELGAAAAAVAGFDISIFINTFGYSNFLSQGGLLFWVLNAALYAAYRNAERRK